MSSGFETLIATTKLGVASATPYLDQCGSLPLEVLGSETVRAGGEDPQSTP